MSVILEQDGVGEPACMPKYVPSEGCIDCSEIIALTTDPGSHTYHCVLLCVGL